MELIFEQSIQWHITEVCRNRCKHCYICEDSNENRRRQELSWEDLLKILHNFDSFEEKFENSIKYFAITGGDPFEHPCFERLLNELYIRNKSIGILGIPERISEDSIKMMDSYNVLLYQVSLDGMKETHDAIRGSGSFEKTINALKLINRYGNMKPAVMYTAHRQNYQEMFEVIDYLDNEKVDVSFSFDFLVPEGNAKQNCLLMQREEVDDFLLRYRNKRQEFIDKHKSVVLKEKVKLFETYNVTNANTKFQKYSYVSGCYCGINSVSVLPNGDLLPCRRLPIKIGNLLYESYDDLFINNEMMRRLRRISSFRLCGDCDYAKVCRGCVALAYATIGDPFGELYLCNRKRKVVPLLDEPPVDCKEEEEIDFLKKNYINAIQKEGVLQNMDVFIYDMKKRGNF